MMLIALLLSNTDKIKRRMQGTKITVRKINKNEEKENTAKILRLSEQSRQ